MSFITFPKLLNKSEEIFSPHILKRARWGLVFLMALVLMLFVETHAISFRQFSLSIIILIVVILLNNLQEAKKELTIGNFGQLLIDVSFLSSIIYLTGGSRNPFTFLLILSPFVAPLFLDIKKSFALLILSLGSLYLQKFSYFQFWHTSDFLEVDFSSTAIVMVALWFFMSWLAYILNRYRNDMEELARRDLRVSRLQAIGSLTSGFCHELGTPMGSMRLAVDRIKSGRGKDFDYQVLDESLKKCEMALQSMVRQSHNEHKMDFEEVPLEEVLQDVASTLASESINIDLTWSNLEKVILEGSRISFFRLFYDLVHNSAEASATKVKISFRNMGENLIFEVKDNGPGFPASVIENFGSPFNSTKSDGMGIGLYNALTYVDLLGGFMKIRNDNGAVIEMSFRNIS